MSRREMRRRPEPAPEGWHWEPTESHFTRGGVSCYADYYLVENGRSINSAGYYEDYERGDGAVPNWPIPRWRAVVGKESQVRTETRKLLAEREREIRSRVMLAAKREAARR